ERGQQRDGGREGAGDGGVLVGEAGGLPADGDREQRWLRAYLCDPGLGGGRGRAAADLGGDFPGVVAEIARRGHGEHAADAADRVGVGVHGRAGGGGRGDGECQGAGGGGGEVAGDGVGDQAGALASGQRGGVDAGPADAGGGHGGKQQEQRGGGGGGGGAARYPGGGRGAAAGGGWGRGGPAPAR